MKKIKIKLSDLLENIFLLIFALLLLGPFLQQHIQYVIFEPLDENRLRAELPSLDELRELSVFKVKLEAYILDNFGFRDELIRLKNEIDYRIMRKSEKVLIDPSGRLFPKYFSFYRDEISKATDQQWLTVFEKFKSLRDQLKKKGIQLLVVPVPLGDCIYPEEYSVLETVCFDRKYHEKFFSYFDDEKINYIDVQKELLLHKEEPLYFHTDFHYTAVGSYYTMKLMLNSLYPLVGQNRVWEYPLEYDFISISDGVLAKYLGTFTQVTDQAPVVKRHWEICAKKVEGGYETICPQKELLPSTVIFGNSFIAGMLDGGFSDEFEKLKVHLVVDLAKEIGNIPADTKIVIVEFYELNMWEFIHKDFLPPITQEK